jgi:hypothetical protein
MCHKRKITAIGLADRKGSGCGLTAPEVGRALVEMETTPEPKNVFTVADFGPVDRKFYV